MLMLPPCQMLIVKIFFTSLSDVKSEDIFPFIQRISKLWIALRCTNLSLDWSRWVFSPTSLLDSDVRLSILRRLREELEADVALANNLLDLLTRYLEQMCSRGPEIMRVESLPDHSLVNYGLHTLQRTTGADMTNSCNLVVTRNELLRSIVEKEEFIRVYRAM
ncbi:hypothetical protein Tco_1399051 [Tanacetum coccineum]